MGISEKNVFVTSDGKEHTTLQKAKAHELRVKCENILQAASVYYDYDVREALTSVLEEKQLFRDWLDAEEAANE